MVKGKCTLKDCKLMFRNFTGKAGKFNREGDRSFAIRLDQEVGQAMLEDGWNVKFLHPRSEGEEPTPYITVKVRFNDYGPTVKLRTNGLIQVMTEQTIGQLDWLELEDVFVRIRPYNWELADGKCGTTAYLDQLGATEVLDEFAKMYGDAPATNVDVPDEGPEELPFL